MRELSYVGVALDDGALVLEGDGERFRLPVSAELRGAVTGRGYQLAIPVEGPLTPRQIQDRLRHGATSAELADVAGMDVAQVARWEAPILAERAHVAAEARDAEVDGRPLGEIVADHLEAGGLDPSEATWDAWRREDGGWLVQVSWQETERRRSARWSFTAATHRLKPVDPAAEAMLRTAADTDDLTAVLRPMRGPTALRPEQPPQSPTGVEAFEPMPWAAPADDEAGEAGGVDAVVADIPSLTGIEADAADSEPAPPRPRPVRRARRASVPSWDEIASGRRSDPPA